MTKEEEVIVRELYADKSKKAYCTSKVPLEFHRHMPVRDENGLRYDVTIDIVPAGTVLKIVMVSRFDDCGLTDSLHAKTGYQCRVLWDSGKIGDIRWEP